MCLLRLCQMEVMVFIREKSLLVRVLVTVELIVHVISIAPHTIIWLLLKIQSGSVFPEDTAQLLSQGAILHQGVSLQVVT
ncbi:hypothetical protein A3467_12160 [Enterobacter roggenkampii]|nr:hypothetical protein A3467_12160 [Enterobacter roggenkampii]